MDFHKLKLVKCVADFKSVSLASEHLGMRQSSISTALSSLEGEIGYKIFQRRYRGMVLTSKGSTLYKFAEKVLADYDQFVSLYKDETNNHKIAGELTIATSYGVSGSDGFIRTLCKLLDTYPDLKLQVMPYKEGDIHNPNVDIFICPRLTESQELANDFIQITMNKFLFRLFASASYIEKFGLPKRTEDLDDHRLLGFSKSSTNPFIDVDLLLNIGREPNNPRSLILELNNNIGLVKMIAQGYGIGVIYLEHGLKEGLIPILNTSHSMTIETCLMYRKNHSKASLIETVSAHFAMGAE